MTSTEIDSGWKEILEEYFPEFLEFFFPDIFKDLDFKKGYEFLDKEFQEIVKDNELGKRFADKLIKVFLKSGLEKWLLVHIEVQGYYDVSFAQRMFVYNYRIFDKFNREVVSLAVLADDSPNFRPKLFHVKRWGFDLRFRFPMIKLLDYRSRLDELEESRNPFAIVVITHLRTFESKKDNEKKLFWKITLVRSLFQKGFSKRNIRNLFRFIDWIIAMPKDFDLKFRKALEKEKKKMPYITSIERIAKEEGIQLGIQQGIQQTLYKGIELALELKFGTEGIKLMLEIGKITDTVVLQTVHSAIKSVKSPQELRRIYKVKPSPKS